MKFTNDYNLPAPFVEAVSREYEYKARRYSVTSVFKGIREAILTRKHHDEITQDVADMVWLIFGTAVHSVLENAQETDSQLKENKLEVEMRNGYTLSGIFDLYDDATGTVTDYKTASVWKVISGDWEDYRKQVLAYVWMLRQIGFDAWRGEIVALLKDHSKTKASTDRTYPQRPVHRIAWNFTLAEIEEMGEWLNSRFSEIAMAEALGEDMLPLCTDAERWHKPDTWAVVKNGNKRASRVVESEAEAEAKLAELAEKTGKPHHIEYRRGEDVKCMKYCAAREFCAHYKALRKGSEA